MGAEAVAVEAVERDVPEWQLARVNGEQFAALHEQMMPILESVYERNSGGLTPQALFDSVVSDEMQVWIATDGYDIAAVMGTSIATLITNKKVCKVHFCAGHHSNQWIHLLDEVEAWAAYEGCTAMEIRARKGWAKRLPNYRLTHVVLEKDL